MNWLQKLCGVQYIQAPPKDQYAEEERGSTAPVAFFEHEGTTLYVIESIAMDSHFDMPFPTYTTDMLMSGRVSHNKQTGSLNLHPDLIDSNNLGAIIGDLMSAFPNVTKWNIEYQGTWYHNFSEVYEELERYR